MYVSNRPGGLFPLFLTSGRDRRTMACMTGGGLQVEVAERIKVRAGADFDRFTAAFEVLSNTQNEPERGETLAIVAIVKELRAQVMANDDAGFFIRGWQDLGDQVRTMVLKDPRVKAIQAQRALRESS